MGMAHTTPGAVPRLAEALAFVTPLQVLPVVDRILSIEREAAPRAGRSTS